jgi:hypothetical protein
VIRRMLTWVAVVSIVGTLGATSAGAVAPIADEADKSARRILADASRALRRADSVAIAGTVSRGTEQISLDIVVTHGSGGGTITAEGMTFQIITAPPDVYLKANAATWAQASGGNEIVAQLLADNWLKTTTDDEDFAEDLRLFDITYWAKQAMQPTGTLTKGSVTNFQGQAAIPLEDEDGPKSGTLYVAATGRPYPLAIVGTGAQQGQVTFSDYGSASVPPPPTDAIDLSEFEQQART